ncbi:MAG: hypothetical protein M3R38_28800 [Actinomycetota bacterium]|nr:hypothetical protein [Actinomycetota bacterium]
MPKITIAPPAEPNTPEEWQRAVDAADALLKLDSARIYGLVKGGPEVDVDRCWDLMHKARELHGIEPSEDAVRRGHHPRAKSPSPKSRRNRRLWLGLWEVAAPLLLTGNHLGQLAVLLALYGVHRAGSDRLLECLPGCRKILVGHIPYLLPHCLFCSAFCTSSPPSMAGLRRRQSALGWHALEV